MSLFMNGVIGEEFRGGGGKHDASDVLFCLRSTCLSSFSVLKQHKQFSTSESRKRLTQYDQNIACVMRFAALDLRVLS